MPIKTLLALVGILIDKYRSFLYCVTKWYISLKKIKLFSYWKYGLNDINDQQTILLDYRLSLKKNDVSKDIIISICKGTKAKGK